MPLSQLIQKLIHMLEQGALARYLRFILLGLVVVGMVLIYDLRAYRNLASQEAMDSAQLARNIAEGKGYTTLFIRPFSLYLVQSHNEARHAAAPAGTNAVDFARIKDGPHPDLANPPVYPLVLASLMKVLPFHYPVDLKKPFWSDASRFWRYQPDFLITVFNQVLLLVVVALTFLLARKLFDASVAWLSALLTLGCELLWRFSASGLSTLLLAVIFLGLTWCVLQIEELARAPQPRPNRLLGLALAAGVLMGAGALTRYAFGWVLIPVAVFLFLFSGPRRALHVLAALGAFMILFAPWVVRNYVVSGTPFGTAGYAIAEGTGLFPQFQLARSLHPDFTHALWFRPYISKLTSNLHDILANDLPKLGGSWASILFLAGLLLGFRGLAARRLRYFLVLCLGLFIVVQALGRTYLSEKSPELNSENLLVLLAPLVFIYGVSFFFTFLDQMKLAMPQLRYVVIGIFVALSCLPMLLISTLMAPKVMPVVYPPYYPPDIQQTAGWMSENELMMSDVPWAVAWYGNRQCIWLTLNAQEDFFAVNDNLKPVLALYLTPETTDGRFVSDWTRAGEHSWGNFMIQAMVQNQIPPGFPLRNAPTGFLPERMFLTDRQRWKTTQ
jgi:hypothetical protein